VRPRLNSVYARVLLLVLGVVMVGGGAVVFASYRQTLHEANELFDAQLAQTGQTLLAIVAHGDDDVAGDLGEASHKYQRRLLFQVWRKHDGRWELLLRSSNAPAEALPLRKAEGFSSADWNGRRWRFFAHGDAEHEMRVVVAQQYQFREELARNVAWQNLLPFAVGLPLLAFLLHFAIRGGLQPLRQLAGDLARRAPDRLEPLAMGEPPAELEPVLTALNRLLGQLQGALENERRFTADAAHELRTPLAALQAQLQVAGLAPTEAERRSALEKSLRGASRMTHLVEQLLTLARIEGDSDALARTETNLAGALQAVCADLGPAVATKDISLGMNAPPSVMLAVQPDLFAVLARNLIDNAVRYTPACGRVEVDLQDADREIVLSVADNGPGVPPDRRALLGQRFGRCQDEGPEGVGLGLSIAGRIAEIHGGRLEFGPGLDGAGFAVTVRFPRPPA